MSQVRMLQVVGEGFKRCSLEGNELQAVILNLRSRGFNVQHFQSGYDCEDCGLQVFRATRMETGDRYHVRFSTAMFPDL